MHLRLDAASAVIAAPSSPDGPPDALRFAQDLVARDSTGRVWLPGLGVLAGRYDRSGATGRNGVMALAGVEGTVGGDAGDLLIGRDLVKQLGQHGRIAHITGRELGGPDLQCLLVSSPSRRMFHAPAGQRMWILRQTRRLAPPCLRAFHSPSPSTLIPVLSISRCNGPADPRYGMLTFRVFCRRDNVLKSGTSQFRLISCSRLSTKPVVCLSAMPNSTFIVRQVWMAASL